MFSFFKNRFSSISSHQLINRIFDVKVLNDEAYQDILEKRGYVHIKNRLNQTDLDELVDIYAGIVEKYNFHNNFPEAINTITISDQEIKKIVREQTTPILQKILSPILQVDKLKMPFGGSFCINRPGAKKNFKPHQDNTYVDELKSYSIVAWIPLTNTNIENGCLHVLPKSHLWDNNKRSASMVWAFENYSELLWKYMIPIIANIGDIIIFDASIVHGSKFNTTNENRLAINVPILPKNQPMVSYHPINKYESLVYEIDESYYIEETLYQKPSNKFKHKGKIALNNIYKQDDVIRLINMSSENNEN